MDGKFASSRGRIVELHRVCINLEGVRGAGGGWMEASKNIEWTIEHFSISSSGFLRSRLPNANIPRQEFLTEIFSEVSCSIGFLIPSFFFVAWNCYWIFEKIVEGLILNLKT